MGSLLALLSVVPATRSAPGIRSPTALDRDALYKPIEDCTGGLHGCNLNKRDLNDDTPQISNFGNVGNGGLADLLNNDDLGFEV